MEGYTFLPEFQVQIRIYLYLEAHIRDLSFEKSGLPGISEGNDWWSRLGALRTFRWSNLREKLSLI